MRETNYRKPQTVPSACLALLLAAGVWHVAGADGRNDDRSPDEMRVIGLTDDGRLVSFKGQSPERTRHIGYVTGLTAADTALVGIDFRVQNEELYGVGNGGGVYTIDPRTAEATFVNALTGRWPERCLASTSIQQLTACGSSATPARTSRTTSTTWV